MKSHKIINLPPAGSTAVGIYEAQVVEPEWLPGYRRAAFNDAGLIFNESGGTGYYDGSYEAYMGLSDAEKQAHDRVLSRMVAKRIRITKQRGKNSTLRSAKLISTTGKCKNLILDQLLNKLLQDSPNVSWSEASLYCAVGTGTTPTYTDSGAITATTAGSSTTVTASGSIFTADHVGQLIKFDSGEERYIASQTGTACVVTVPVNITAPTLFTIWAVNQTGLASESKRTNTYLTGTGNCGRTQASNVFTYRRTYDFSAEVGNVNYTELGVSESGTVAANLNTRTLISGGTVSVLIGQQLRVIYDLVVTFTPASSTPGNWAITGWPVAPSTTTDGDYICCNPANNAPNMNTSGAVLFVDSWPYRCSSPINPSATLGTSSVLPTFGSDYSPGTSVSSNTNTVSAYTAGTFYRDGQSVFNLTTGNRTDWRGIAHGSTSGLVFVFDEAQTKASTHTLTVRSRMTVGRTLTNP